MLFKIVLMLSLCGVSLIASPVIAPKRGNAEDFVPIVNQDTDVSFDGQYHYSYESGDGTKVVQSGESKAIGTDNAVQAVVGEYSYTGSDGKLYKVSYKSDENGYRAEGDHLPKTSAIILRALSNIAARLENDEE